MLWVTVSVVRGVFVFVFVIHQRPSVSSEGSHFSFVIPLRSNSKPLSPIRNEWSCQTGSVLTFVLLDVSSNIYIVIWLSSKKHSQWSIRPWSNPITNTFASKLLNRSCLNAFLRTHTLFYSRDKLVSSQISL